MAAGTAAPAPAPERRRKAQPPTPAALHASRLAILRSPADRAKGRGSRGPSEHERSSAHHRRAIAFELEHERREPRYRRVARRGAADDVLLAIGLEEAADDFVGSVAAEAASARLRRVARAQSRTRVAFLTTLSSLCRPPSRRDKGPALASTGTLALRNVPAARPLRPTWRSLVVALVWVVVDWALPGPWIVTLLVSAIALQGVAVASRSLGRPSSSGARSRPVSAVLLGLIGPVRTAGGPGPNRCLGRQREPIHGF